MMMLAAALAALSAFADDYIAVGREGKVFDDPSPKYVTLNEKNEEVTVIPGMVFKTNEHKPGWYMIEYSPGLHAYLSETVVSNNTVAPKAGTYDVRNNPGHKLAVENSAGNWTAAADGKSYAGSQNGNIVVFTDASGNSAYSLVDFGDGPIVICYDNSVTRFF